MTQEHIDALRDRAGYVLMHGMFTDIWLDHPSTAERDAGGWSIGLRVDELFELLDLAEKGMKA